MLAVLPALILTYTTSSSHLVGQNTASANQAFSSSQLVTYHGTAETVEKALAGICSVASSPITIKVGDSLKNEIILVDVNNVPLKELMQKIAKVEFAKWTFEGNLAFLNADSNATQAQEDKSYTAWSNELRDELNQIISPQKQPSKINPNSHIPSEYPPVGDVSVEASELLKNIGPKLIVSLPKGDRIVFSSNPTATQRPFPIGCDNLLNFLAKKTSNGASFSINYEAGVSSEPHTGDNGSSPKSGQGPQVAKMDLILEKPDSFSGMIGLGYRFLTTARLVDFDEKGKQLGELQLNIPDFSSNGDLLKAFSPPIHKKSNGVAEGASPSPLSEPIALSGTPQKMILAVKQFEEAERDPASGNDKAYLPFALDPVTFDPLLAIGALISKASDSYHLNLVASLPDSLYKFTDVLAFGKELPSPQKMMEILNGITEIQTDKSNGWFTIHATLPSESRASRMDRHYLKIIDNYFRSSPDPDIDSLAKMAVALHGVVPALAKDYIWRSSLSSTNYMEMNWHLLQFYGLLDESQKNALDLGQSISYSSLSDEAKSVARFLTFGARQQLYTDLRPQSENKHSSDTDISTLLGDNPLIEAKNYESEPTEVAPNGMPSQSPITEQVEKSSAYHMMIESAPSDKITTIYDNAAFTPGMVALLLAEKNAPLASSEGSTIPKIKEFIQGSQTSLTIKIYITQEIFAGGIIHECQFPENAKTFTEAKLPDDIKSLMGAMNNFVKHVSNNSASKSGNGP